MMLLNQLKKRISHKDKKTRLGRGIGTGHGGHTSTRGQKGQKARTGGKVPQYFEGGQLPLVKRLPHLKGFTSFTKKHPIRIKTSLINKLEAKEYTPEDLAKLNVVKKNADGFKFLFDVEVTVPVKLKGFNYSKSAKSSIEKAGGSAN